MRDLAVQRRVYGAHDVLEREIRQRAAPVAVRRQCRAIHVQIDGPLGDPVAHDADARHLRVRRRLLEIVWAQRRDVVRAGPGALLEDQVGQGKVDVEMLGDDLPVDKVV